MYATPHAYFTRPASELARR